MNSFQKTAGASILTLMLITGTGGGLLQAKAKPQPQTAAATSSSAKPPSNISYTTVDPLALLRNPDQHIGQAVTFDDTFVTFSPYALDYKPALRSSKDYIAFLVQRPDATRHVIPLSELKLIYPRKKVDKVMDLENGDKINVKGRIFSAALGDPWVDVDEITLIQKSPANLAKAAKKKKKHE